MASFETVSDYIAAQPAPVQRLLKRVRTLLKAAVPPGSEELLSYKIPALRIGGKVALFYSAWKDHLSIYPASAGVRRALGKDLAPYLVSKGTLSFKYADPLPAHLIQRIAAARAAEFVTRPKPAARTPRGRRGPPARPESRTSRRG